MEKIYKISLLLDFYGQLLTERQLEVLNLHFNNDYSLGEIAEQLNISRQGVYDNVKRGRTSLNTFEDKLGLLKKFFEQRERIFKSIKNIEDINKENMSENDIQKLRLIEKNLKEAINAL